MICGRNDLQRDRQRCCVCRSSVPTHLSFPDCPAWRGGACESIGTTIRHRDGPIDCFTRAVYFVRRPRLAESNRRASSARRIHCSQRASGRDIRRFTQSIPYHGHIRPSHHKETPQRARSATILPLPRAPARKSWRLVQLGLASGDNPRCPQRIHQHESSDAYSLLCQNCG
jgi:hypothetical protein